MELECRDGSRIWTETNVSVLRNPGGEPIGFAGVTRDVSQRKRQQEELRAKETHFGDVLRMAGKVAFVQLDLCDTGASIVYFSPGSEQIFGYGSEEAIGKPIAAIHLAEDVPALPEVFKTLRQTKSALTMDTTLLRKSGDRFRALVSIHPVMDDKGDLTSALYVAIDLADVVEMRQGSVV